MVRDGRVAFQYSTPFPRTDGLERIRRNPVDLEIPATTASALGTAAFKWRIRELRIEAAI
jgi:hypothetical protein